jgi:hypothetical protein
VLGVLFAPAWWLVRSVMEEAAALEKLTSVIANRADKKLQL